MKKFLFLITAVFFYSHYCMSQDIIFLKNGSVIDAKIQEIHESEIKYKKSDNIGGPSYFLSAEKVNKIVFANGHTEKFSKSNSMEIRSTQHNLIIEKDYPKITYNPRGKKSERYKIDGRVISLREVANYLKVNNAAYDNFSSAKAFNGLYTTSVVFLGVSAFGGVLVYAITDSKVPLIVAMAGTIVFYPLGLVFKNQHKKFMTKAIDIYNEGIPYSLLRKKSNITAKLGVTSNGIGVCFTF